MTARSFQGWISLELWPMGRGTFTLLTSKKAPSGILQALVPFALRALGWILWDEKRLY